jgi:hypothetical protein
MPDTSIQPATRTFNRHAINYSSLAQDLCLYGQEDIEGVMRAHRLDEETLEDLLLNSIPLRKKIGQLKKQLDGDPAAILRMKASSAVEGQLPTLSSMISDVDNDTKDRIAAMRLMAELANALPKTPAAGAGNLHGVVLNLNLGTVDPAKVHDLPKPVNVIEHAP